MQLLRMAFIDFDPSPGVETPEIGFDVEGAAVHWVARWANENGSGLAVRKVYEDAPAPVRIRTVNDPDQVTEDDRPITPVWLNLPRADPADGEAWGGEEQGTGRRFSIAYEATSATELVVAGIPLPELPRRDEDGLVHLPEDALQATHAAIERFADLIAICTPAARQISSPRLPVALVPNGPEEVEWLASCSGIEGLRGGRTESSGVSALDVGALDPDALGDRVDGLVVLADAFSQSWPTGRFRELWRFFELAFAAPSGRLAKPLGDFLASGSLELGRRDVQGWVKLRGPAVHADRARRVLLASEVVPFLRPMERAAQDVLFHKRDWRSPSCERRSAAAADPSSKAFHERSAGFTVYPKLGCGPLRWLAPEWVVSFEGMWPDLAEGVEV
jgi:hypothetical protein